MTFKRLEIVSLVSLLKRLLSIAFGFVNDMTVDSFSFHADQNTVNISTMDLEGYVNN